MIAIMPTCRAPAMSSARRAGAGLGGSEAMPCHSDTPNAMPTTETPSIPMRGAPGTPRAARAAMTQKPARARTGAGAVRSPAVTIVASLAWMMPAFCSARIPRKRPMPAGMASFSARGTASMIRRRTGSTLRARNSRPAMKTAPSATSQS